MSTTGNKLSAAFQRDLNKARATGREDRKVFGVYRVCKNGQPGKSSIDSCTTAEAAGARATQLMNLNPGLIFVVKVTSCSSSA